MRSRASLFLVRMLAHIVQSKLLGTYLYEVGAAKA